ncbi:hypothetical protein ACNQR9_32630 [Mycolicibacterium peregrinum]
MLHTLLERSAVIAAGVVLAASTLFGSTAASADPPTNLSSAADTLRAASQCPPLQPNPLVTRAAEMATNETSDYIAHRTAVVPFTDPVPALNTIGYPTGKALLFTGYDPNEADSIQGLTLTMRKDIRDCTLTQYGTSTRHEDGFVLTAAVLTTP